MVERIAAVTDLIATSQHQRPQLQMRKQMLQAFHDTGLKLRSLTRPMNDAAIVEPDGDVFIQDLRADMDQVEF